jgi:hypothetical protein
MTNDPPIETLSIRVERLLPTTDLEVVLFTEQGRLLKRFASDMVGLDPSDLFTEPCPLVPVDEAPFVATIGRCSCGEEMCSALEVEIRAEGGAVWWSGPELRVRFDRAQYEREWRRASQDRSWEPTGRRLSRLLRGSVDRARLAGLGLAYQGASIQERQRTITVTLGLEPGPYQLFLRLPWNGEGAEALAERCRELLAQGPDAWPGVTYLPQRANLPPPPMARPSWRPEGR